MNHFGELARDHWAEWLPTRFHEIENPDDFFAGLGQEVSQQIHATIDATTIPSSVPPEKVAGWWNMARLSAENQALSEMVFLPPEEGLEEPELPIDPYLPDRISYEIMMEFYAEREEESILEQLAWDAERAAQNP